MTSAQFVFDHHSGSAAAGLRSARRGQGVCSCVVVFYEAGQKAGDWRLSAPQSGIREEE